MRRAFSVWALTGLLLFSAAPLSGLAAESDALPLDAAADAQRGHATAVEFRLPKQVAAVDGRLFIDGASAEVIGLAPVGGGHAFLPEQISPNEIAFGAYGLKPAHGQTVMRVILAPLVEGRLQFRVVIDAAADQNGNRLEIRAAKGSGSIRVNGGGNVLAAPAAKSRLVPLRAAGKTRDLVGDGTIGKQDLDIVRAGWEVARARGEMCGADIDTSADANGDGCVDIVDVQAVFAAKGQQVDGDAATGIIDTRLVASIAGGPVGPTIKAFEASAGPNFVVDSTADTADATPGDGVCADTLNRCTLRAAITEANWWRGENRIEFNLVGIAPVAIQITTAVLPLLQDRSGGTIINGYSQPGSRVNTAAFGSNAIPGVLLVGPGTANSARNPLRVTSPNNTIRGLAFNNFNRALMVDGADAKNNRIIGNWLGFNANGTPASSSGQYNILVNTGASNNVIGTPNLADRNVSGRASQALKFFGPGVHGNVTQNNLMCATPTGTNTTSASCSTAIDHDHGPKNNLVGGSGTNERNIIGRTSLNGIEFSHGWDPSGFDDATWQVNDNRAIGNWVGFRHDGSYDSTFRSGQNNPGGGDNGNGINVYDGSNNNLVEGNYVASVYDGIQTMSSNSTGNIIRNNIIGQSPLGQAAPLTRWGMVARLSTRSHLMEGNTVRNAAAGGIGLTHAAVRFIRMSKNIISNTTGPAIFLQPDAANPSIGANNLQAPPVITSATTISVSGTGVNGATVEVYRADRPAGQSGLPVEYLGSAVVSGGAWTVPVSVAQGDRVTALQTPTNGNTSTLSVNVATTFQTAPPPPTADFTWGQQAGSLGVNFTDTSTGSPTSWSWNFGDGTSSTEQHPTKTYAAAGNYSVTLTATNAGGSSNRTRNITVAAVSTPSQVAADAFSRTVSGGWGTADIGGAYTTSQGPTADYSVSGGTGNIVMPSANTSRSALLNNTSQRDVDVRFRVRTDKVPTGGNSFIYAVARRNGTNEYRPRMILNANGTVSVNASVVINGTESALGTAVVVSGLTQSANSFIWLRAQVTGASPTTVRVKAWADGQAEPSGWQFSVTNNAAAVQTAGSLGLRTYVNSSINNAPITFSFDDYSVALP
jgi:CSLREA domain-containing protein